MKDELIWNVLSVRPYVWRVEPYNIFRHCDFRKDVWRTIINSKLTKTEKEERIKHWLRYYFWHKSEHEISVFGVPTSQKDRGETVDIYSQVIMNWSVFFSYLWENKGLL